MPREKFRPAVMSGILARTVMADNPPALLCIIGVSITILGGIRTAVHPSLSKSRRLVGERPGSAYKHDAQASECVSECVRE